MPKYYSVILLFLLFLSSCIYGQKKTLQAKSIVDKITIDGKINEEIWKTAQVASDFIMFEPDNGKPISQGKRTEAKVLYDNSALYISALLYDDEPTKISKEVTNRDIFRFPSMGTMTANKILDFTSVLPESKWIV